MLETPVVFIVFNRPETTSQVWKRICAAQPARLFVVADGPRAGRPAEVERCARVREIVEQVDWTCEVSREYSPGNLGAAVRVSSGLDWVFSQVPEAIILEDDCVPDPSFFPFCSELLARYRNEPRVAQIAGCSFQPEDCERESSYYFSRYPHCWGWATWRRAWQSYDHTMRDWVNNRGGKWLAQCIRNSAERRMWERHFDATLAGGVDSWAYRWTLAIWRNQWVSILPYQNLISNIGFGAEATHTKGPSPWAARRLASMSFPLVHPRTFHCDKKADDRTGRLVFQPPSLLQRLRARLRRWLAQ